MIQLFNIITRTLGFAFCQPQKRSLPKSLTQKKSLQNFKPKKSPQIANFKPKKGLRTSPSLIYLSTPLGIYLAIKMDFRHKFACFNVPYLQQAICFTSLENRKINPCKLINILSPSNHLQEHLKPTHSPVKSADSLIHPIMTIMIILAH